MGTKDITENHLEEYNDVFADIANVLLFHGKRVIQEGDLESTPARTMYKADDDTVHEQERDVSKFWRQGRIRFALLGYTINLFEIAFLSEEQVNMFQSDFKIVADYFVQMRKNNDYVASKEEMEHVDAVLKLMSVLTQDDRFYEAQNYLEGEGRTMCEYLDRIIEEGRAEGKVEGALETLISLVQDGLLSVEEAAKRVDMSVEDFKKICNCSEPYPVRCFAKQNPEKSV